MQIHNVEQGSQEWLQLKLGVASASNFDKIITTKGDESKQLNEYAFQLAYEKLLIAPAFQYKNDAMLRGNELESQAIDEYKMQELTDVDSCGIIISDCGNFGYSPDGLIGEDGLIEAKCPIEKTYAKYLLNKDELKNDYWQQVQGGLFVSERKWIDLIAFQPNYKKKKLIAVRIERDEEYLSKLKILLDRVIILRNEYLKQLES